MKKEPQSNSVHEKQTQHLTSYIYSGDAGNPELASILQNTDH